jgi:hypothetical protein
MIEFVHNSMVSAVAVIAKAIKTSDPNHCRGLHSTRFGSLM